MIGGILTILLGSVLGWLCGHLAVLIPTRDRKSLRVDLLEISSAPRTEHCLGVLLGVCSLGLIYLLDASVTEILITGIFLLVLIPTLIIDLFYHLIYPVLTLIGFVLGLALNPIGDSAGFVGSLAGASLATLAFLGLFLLGRLLFGVEALGFGDVLLAGMIGSMVGLGQIVATLFLSTLVTGLAAVVLLLMRRKGRRDYIPMGSGICLATILVLVVR